MTLFIQTADKYNQYCAVFHYRLHTNDLARLLGTSIALMPRFSMFEARYKGDGEQNGESSPKKSKLVPRKFEAGFVQEKAKMDERSTGF